MPRCAFEAIHGGLPVVYRGAGDWQRIEDDEGNVTCRYPMGDS
jgi:hypothetical protein